jgi:hypothetical protein
LKQSGEAGKKSTKKLDLMLCYIVALSGVVAVGRNHGTDETRTAAHISRP